MQVEGMATGSINPNGLASGWSATTPSFEAFDSPLGRWVEILGRMPPCKECEKFKVEYGKWPDPGTPPTTFYALTDPFKERVELWPWQIRVDRLPPIWLSAVLTFIPPGSPTVGFFLVSEGMTGTMGSCPYEREAHRPRPHYFKILVYRAETGENTVSPDFNQSNVKYTGALQVFE